MQHQSAVTQKLTELVAPCLASMGLTLWGVEMAQSGRRLVARLFLDLAPDTPRTPQRQGVTVDECATVSRRLSALLDVEEVLHGPYVLEVSSPGFGRRFFSAGQLPDYLGREIEARLIVPRDGRKRFRGTLAAVAGDRVTMTVDPGPKAFPLTFAFEEADKIRLIHAFDATCEGGTGDDGPPSGTSEETP
jgi:ribosome maturation factor RimP